MRKLLKTSILGLSFLAMGLNSETAMAQRWGGGGYEAFSQGTSTLTAGYGVGNLAKTWFKTYESFGGYKATGMGPFHLRYEYGVSDRIGLGVSVNYVSYGAKWEDMGDTYEIGASSWNVLGRMNWHFATGEKLDPYWAVGVGYNSTTWSTKSTDEGYDFSLKSPLFIGFESVVGLRYYFTDNIGLYAEVGFSKSLAQAGLAVKF